MKRIIFATVAVFAAYSWNDICNALNPDPTASRDDKIEKGTRETRLAYFYSLPSHYQEVWQEDYQICMKTSGSYRDKCACEANPYVHSLRGTIDVHDGEKTGYGISVRWCHGG